MYNPCVECLNRFGRKYSAECADICSYAHEIKLKDIQIKSLEDTIKIKDEDLGTEKARTARLVAHNARLAYDLNHAYQTICILKGDHY